MKKISLPSSLGSALPIVGTYALFASVWIAFSDSALGVLVTEPEDLVHMSMIKGLLFVGVTSLLLFALVRKQINQLQGIHEEELDGERAKNDALLLLDAISNSTDDAIFAKDLEGRYLLFNQAAARIVGKSASDVIGHTDRHLFPSDQADMLIAIDQRVIANGAIQSAEEVLQTVDGVRTFIGKKGPLRGSDGRLLGTFGISRDVTSIREIEQMLQRSQNQLQLFIDHAPSALAMFDRELNYLSVSRRWLSDYGLGGQNLIGKSHYEIFPNLPEAWKEVHQRALRGEVISAKEDCFRQDDSTQRWLNWEVRPWYLDAETIGGIVILSEDVTERRIAADRLAESEQRWRFALDGSRLGLWDWDIVADSVYFSPHWKGMLGYADEEIENRVEEWTQRVHPEDSAVVMEAVNRHTRGETPLYSQEHRVRCKNGEYKWILDRGMVVARDAKGEPTRMIGTHTDLSDIKAAHQALEDSE